MGGEDSRGGGEVQNTRMAVNATVEARVEKFKSCIEGEAVHRGMEEEMMWSRVEGVGEVVVERKRR